MLPLDVEIDLDVQRPVRRTIPWIAKNVPLPDRRAELELLRDVTDELKHDDEQAELTRMDQLTGLNIGVPPKRSSLASCLGRAATHVPSRSCSQTSTRSSGSTTSSATMRATRSCAP